MEHFLKYGGASEMHEQILLYMTDLKVLHPKALANRYTQTELAADIVALLGRMTKITKTLEKVVKGEPTERSAVPGVLAQIEATEKSFALIKETAARFLDTKAKRGRSRVAQ